MLDQINRFINLYVSTLALVFRLKIWLPLLILFGCNWLILYAHYDFSSPIFHGLIGGWVELLDTIGGSEEAKDFMKYPHHLFYLSEKFGWAKLLFALIFEGLILGIVAQRFVTAFGREHVTIKKPIKKLWFQLILAWLIVNLLTTLIGMFLPDLILPLLDGPRRIFAFVAILLPSLYILIFSLFIFMIPSISIFGFSFIKSLGHSLSTFFKNPISSILLAFSILVLPIFFSVLSGYSRNIIEDFRPELVYWIIVLMIFSELLANFIWMGATVRFLTEHDRLPKLK